MSLRSGNSRTTREKQGTKEMTTPTQEMQGEENADVIITEETPQEGGINEQGAGEEIILEKEDMTLQMLAFLKNMKEEINKGLEKMQSGQEEMKGKLECVKEEIKAELNVLTREVENNKEEIKQNKNDIKHLREGQKQIRAELNKKVDSLTKEELERKILRTNKELQGIEKDLREEIRQNLSIAEVENEKLRRVIINEKNQIENNLKITVENLQRGMRNTGTGAMGDRNIVNNIHHYQENTIKFDGDCRKIHPKIFSKMLKNKVRMTENVEEWKDIVRNNLTGQAQLWFTCIEYNLINYEEFEEKFNKNFWGDLQQGQARERLFFGKYNDRGTTMTNYLLQLYTQMQQLEPSLKEEDIVMYMSRHFKPSITETVGIQNIKTFEGLLNYISRVERTTGNSNYVERQERTYNYNKNNNQNFNNKDIKQTYDNRNKQNYNNNNNNNFSQNNSNNNDRYNINRNNNNNSRPYQNINNNRTYTNYNNNNRTERQYNNRFNNNNRFEQNYVRRQPQERNAEGNPQNNGIHVNFNRTQNVEDNVTSRDVGEAVQHTQMSSPEENPQNFQ